MPVADPRAVFARPPVPTGTLLVVSVATVDYHLDLAPLEVRRRLSNPIPGALHACVAVSRASIPWPSPRPFARATPGATWLTVPPHVPHAWQVERRRLRRRQPRRRPLVQPEEGR